MENLGTMVLATGALGTAAFGIIEGLKWTRLGEAGFAAIVRLLGPLVEMLKVAYGPEYEGLLRAQFRGDPEELARTIRQGLRIGLTESNAAAAANFLGTVDGAELQMAAGEMLRHEEMSADLRNVLGRFELAADARIDAALALARNRYVGSVRMAASGVALGIALIVGFYLGTGFLFQSIIVGVAAVPLAPIAKDLVTALQAAGRAVGARP